MFENIPSVGVFSNLPLHNFHLYTKFCILSSTPLIGFPIFDIVLAKYACFHHIHKIGFYLSNIVIF